MCLQEEKHITERGHPVPVRASSKGCTIRQVELLLNKLLTTAFEAFSVNSVQEVQ